MAYLISPVDLIPDLYLPWVGWIDDSLVLICLYHLIRYGKLPDFLFKKGSRRSRQGQNSRTTNSFDAFKNDEKPSDGRTNSYNQSKTSHQSPKVHASGKNDTDRSAYEILGVGKDASWSQIQTAYKNKAKQYHPDKLSHLGEEFSNLANEKFLEIQAAYLKLKKRHNR